jgi:hypothetical protein
MESTKYCAPHVCFSLFTLSQAQERRWSIERALQSTSSSNRSQLRSWFLLSSPSVSHRHCREHRAQIVACRQGAIAPGSRPRAAAASRRAPPTSCLPREGGARRALQLAVVHGDSGELRHSGELFISLSIRLILLGTVATELLISDFWISLTI